MSGKSYQQLWYNHLIKLFLQQDIKNFFISPGHRSLPLVKSIINTPDAKITWAIDERSLGFMALGFSKKKNIPTVVVTTSGTAVANLYPSIIESYNSLIPLIILTADRPFELRGCGANQTINQTNIFSNHIKKSIDVPPLSNNVSPYQSLSQIEYLIDISQSLPRGPVHINLQIRNLYNQEEVYSFKSFELKNKISHLHKKLSNKKILLVVGEMLPNTLQNRLLACAKKFNWPVFADILSNMRTTRHENNLCFLESSFRSFHQLKDAKPEVILYCGKRIVSKNFYEMILNSRAKCIMLLESHENFDVLGMFHKIYVNDLNNFLDSLFVKDIKQSPLSFLNCVQKLNQRIKTSLAHFLEFKEHNEMYFSIRLLNKISKPTNVFVGASMPIRYLNIALGPLDEHVSIYANRGASGIDGTLSTGIGIALADKKPTIILCGDVSFLHDSNGLMALKNAPFVLVVVINNKGGSIFHMLPVAKDEKVLSPYLDTPHEISIKNICIAHGIQYTAVENARSFDKAIDDFFSFGISGVVEVVIDKAINVSKFNAFIKEVDHELGKSERL